MAGWRRPSSKILRIRANFYRQYISDDVSEFMAWRLPKSSPIAKRAVRLMKKMVQERYAAEHSKDPDYIFQDAIDDVTSEIITKIETGEDVDYALKSLTSP